jgi:methylmalonyl-CoA mutase
MNPKSIQRSPFALRTLVDWRAQVERDLKGADFDKRLVWSTPEGLKIHPLYTEEDRPSTPDYSGIPGGQSRARGEQPVGRPKPWQVCSVIREPEPKAAAALAADELANGATGLLFEASSPWKDPSMWSALFQAIHGSPVHLSLPSNPRKTKALRGLLAAAKASGHPADALHIYAGIDVIGDYASRGTLDRTAWTEVAALLTAGEAPVRRLLRSDDSTYHRAGASEAQSLGFSLAGAIDSLRQLEALQISLDTASAQLELMLHLDSEFFMGIAKIRAARWLWQQVRQAVGFTSALRVHVRTSPRVLTSRDPWVNMLRNTTTCFAGAVAGAEAISTDSFDARLGVPSQTGQRLARNTQLILGLESHLHEVIDPAGGSYFLEHLTEALATEAWSILQRVEARGGMLAALESGWVHDQIGVSREERLKQIHRRKKAITGVSEFPNLAEQIPEQAPYPAQETLAAAAEPSSAYPLRPTHFAEPFELLRDRSDQRLATHGQRPQIGLLNLGTIASHTARSTFIRNLVEVGGFEALPSAPVHTVQEAITQLPRLNGAPLILCGSNAAAEELARPIARALREAGAPLIWLAGKPKGDMSSYAEAGISEWIGLGDDMVERLQTLWAHVEGK